MERSARSRLERGREAEKEESRKGKRLLVSTLDPLKYRAWYLTYSRRNKIDFTKIN
jgi:hypothetical protein